MNTNDILTQALDAAFGAFTLVTGDWTLIVWITVGVLWGAICGIMPGIGTAFGIGVVLPLTLTMEPVTAVGFLVAISVGAAFGNSPPAILLNLASGPTMVLTAEDGYALTRAGRPSLALATSWLAAVAGQLASVPVFIVLVIFAAQAGGALLSPELFAMYVFGLCASIGLIGRDVLKGVAAAALGVILASVGMDPVTGVSRLSFGIPSLREDLPVLPVVLGLITLGQLGSMLSRGERWQRFDSTGLKPPALTSLSPVVIPTIIGGVLGSTVGAVPGLSGYVSARLSRTITLLFGRSDSLERRHVRGLAANESAQNAAQAGEMVPTLGLGIPGSDSMVLVLAALSLQNLTPGPFLLTSSPELLSATIAALLVGALVLLPTGWILGRMLLKIVSVDQNVVLPIALFATFVGVYITRNDTTDVVLLICLGLIGAVMTTHAYPTAVTAIAFVLADGAETNFRQGILLVESDLAAFVGRPWVALILFASAAVLALGVLQAQSASPSEPPRHV